MNTKRSSLLCFLVSLFAVIAVLSFRAEAQMGPGRESKVEGDIDPYEVTLYQASNYVNPIKSLKLSPGMRMLRVSKLDKAPLSILLGSKVGVVLFPNVDLSSKTYRISSYTDDGTGSKVNPKFYLLGYFRFKGSTPDTGMEKIIQGPCSLIIHRKDISDYLGLYLESITSNELGQSGSWGQFYPLPDDANNLTVIYHKIPQGGRFKLQYMAGGLGAQSLFPSTTPPYPENLAVTITSPSTTLKLPEPKPQTIEWQLDKEGIAQISSIRIQYMGPFHEDAYLSPKAVRAPPAPDPPKPAGSLATGKQGPGAVQAGQAAQGPKPEQMTALKTPDVSGIWKSSIGLVYEIRQRGDQFGWSVANSDEKGRGSCQGKAVSATWTNRAGAGSAKGNITGADASGKATRIEWDNGVVFFR